VAVKELIVDPATLDVNRVIADRAEIHRYIPQRFEMEQLTAIILADFERRICAGYKDITANEFWVRGHMPNMPLMPGVVMCEAAAQLSTYFVQKYDLLGVDMIGFGGLDEVRFRDVVRVGDRLLMAVELLKVRRKQMIQCRFQSFVKTKLVCEGKIIGVPLPTELLAIRPEPNAECGMSSAE
jgi:3-hydroxyacyl-[acyl-carrier-protein] dehydratase